MKLFFASIKISSLESRINDLAQEVAIRDERFLGLKSLDQQAQENICENVNNKNDNKKL